MKKTILKTAIITIVSLLAATIVTISLIVIISPKTMGKMYNDFGSKTNAVRLYERQYNTKGKTFNDLKDFIDVLISADDEVKINEYGSDLVVGKKSELKALSDSEKNSKYRSLYDYYAIRVAEAALSLGLKGKAAEVAFKTTDDYNEDCSLYHLVRLSLDNNDKELAVCIYARYISPEFASTIKSGENELNNDIQKLDDLFKITQVSESGQE